MICLDAVCDMHELLFVVDQLSMRQQNKSYPFDNNNK